MLQLEIFFFLAVYLQPIFWILFYVAPWNLERLRKIFPLAWILFVAIAVPRIMVALNVTLYPLFLVLFYGAMLLSYYFWIDRNCPGLPFNKLASLAFLLTFFCSYWWEWPIHVVGLFQHGLNASVIVQATHLLPLIFLVGHVFRLSNPSKEALKVIVDHIFWTVLVVGIASSLIYNFRDPGPMPDWLYFGLQYGCRITAFYTLGHLFLDSKAFILRTVK